MRDITGKIEDSGATSAGRLSATEHNDVWNDINDLIDRSGQQINSADTSQTSEATTLAAFRASAFTVDGSSTANNIVLVCRSGSTGHRIPTSAGPSSAPVYDRYDGATINFTPTAANTGAVTVNIGQNSISLLGSKKLLSSTGAALGSGDIQSGVRVECQFDSSADGGAGAWLLTTAAFVQSDWDQASSSQPDFIQNKPGTPTETVAGLPEVATQAETDAGTSDIVMVTPLKLKNTIYTFKPGDIIQRSTEVSVSGDFLECNGQAVSRTTYSDLLAKIGTIHGEGDGSTTFNVPNIPRTFTPQSTNPFIALSEPFANPVTDVSIYPAGGDVYACAAADVRVWLKSSGTWSGLTPPSLSWSGITFNDLLQRIYVCSSGGGVYYTVRTPVSWVQWVTPPSLTWLGITSDAKIGTNYLFTSSAVYQYDSPLFTSPGLITTPGSGYAAMAINSETSDVYLATATGTIYRRENGIGSFVEYASLSATALTGMDVNPVSGDVYVTADNILYVQLRGRGPFMQILGSLSTDHGVAANGDDGAVVYVDSTDVHRRPGNSISSYIAY